MRQARVQIKSIPLPSGKRRVSNVIIAGTCVKSSRVLDINLESKGISSDIVLSIFKCIVIIPNISVIAVVLRCNRPLPLRGLLTRKKVRALNKVIPCVNIQTNLVSWAAPLIPGITRLVVNLVRSSQVDS